MFKVEEGIKLIERMRDKGILEMEERRKRRRAELRNRDYAAK